MSKPLSTLPNPVEPDANLTSALAQIGAEVENQPLRSSALARIMRETFHGSDAGGAWDWRMAYDLMQAAAVQVLLRGEGASGDIAAARLLASRLLTETRRSEQQIRLQQFSTPLPFAALVLRAAAIREGETVLEPSAGTGALAAFAARAGATLVLNEIDSFRQRLLRAVFGGEVTGHDGEHIDDLLQSPVLPDVVVMNPPFASSVDRSRDKHIAAKHLVAAAKRLAPGGRLPARLIEEGDLSEAQLETIIMAHDAHGRSGFLRRFPTILLEEDRMTLDEIKAAVDAGQTVHWANTGYVVHKDRLGQYLITYQPNGSCIGLTDRSGHRLNGKETVFFVAQSKDAAENPGNQSRPDGQGRGVAPGGAGAFPLGRQL